jgi:hypothetical protein
MHFPRSTLSRGSRPDLKSSLKVETEFFKFFQKNENSS